MSMDSTTVLELPGFRDGETMSVRVRRPSLLAMAAGGTIPNELLGCARRLFCEGVSDSLPLDQLGRVLISVARQAMVEPTYDDLAAQGCELTDMQLSAIYAFSQTGVRSLACFPAGGDGAQSAGDKQAVSDKTQPDTRA